MNELYHVTELFGSLQYGKLRKKRIIPNQTFFTKIKKYGGKFPKLAKKVDSWWLGYFMDRFVRIVLHTRSYSENYLSDVLEEVKELTNEEQCTKKDLLKEKNYFSEIANWLLENLPEYKTQIFEPTWTFQNIQGHPDIILDDCIYDVKYTGRFGKMRIKTIYQLLSYYSMAQKNNMNINYIGLILPAQKEIIRVKINSNWDGSNFLNKLNELSNIKKQLECNDEKLLEKYQTEIEPNIGTHVKKLNTLFSTCKTLHPSRPIQIFLSSRMNVKHKISKADIQKSKNYIIENNIKVFVHTPYSINLARRYDDDWIINSLEKQLETTHKFGGSGCVVHIGKQADMEYNIAWDNMMENICVSASFAHPDCPLLLETDSGGSLCDNPEDLADLWLGIDEEDIRNNIGICVDTCHVFAAGYDIMKTLLMFKQKNVPVKLIHFNDSKAFQGSKKDLHARIGSGMIGMEKLISVAEYALQENIPMVIE